MLDYYRAIVNYDCKRFYSIAATFHGEKTSKLRIKFPKPFSPALINKLERFVIAKFFLFGLILVNKAKVTVR